MKHYTPPTAGGTWAHRSWDCPAHGPNVPFFRPLGGAGIGACVACALATPTVRVYAWTRVIVARGVYITGLLPLPAADAPEADPEDLHIAAE